MATPVQCRKFKRGLGSVPQPRNTDDQLPSCRLSDSTICSSTLDGVVVQNSQLINVTGVVIDSFHDGVGLQSTGVGRTAVADGDFSVSLGFAVAATGDSSVAVGSTAIASDVGGVAVGAAAMASGLRALALGPSVTAGTDDSIVIANTAVSTVGAGSVFVGRSALSNAATNSVVLGKDNNVEGNKQVAIGNDIVISAGTSASVVLGDSASSTVNNGIAIGPFAQNQSISGMAIGNGTLTSGDNAIAIGTSAIASAVDGIAIGQGAQGAQQAVAIGLNSDAPDRSVSIGDTAICTSATGLAVAIGADSSSGARGVAVGRFAVTLLNGVAIGEASSAGSTSVAIGQIAVADDGGVSVGRSTQTGLRSIAIGENTTAIPLDCVAIGHDLVNNQADTVLIGAGSDYAMWSAPDSVVQASLGASVTINSTDGRITLGDPIPAGATNTFTVNNSFVTANSRIFLNHMEGPNGTFFVYRPRNVAAGTFDIQLFNVGLVDGGGDIIFRVTSFPSN